jgi:hypothetical protein
MAVVANAVTREGYHEFEAQEEEDVIHFTGQIVVVTSGGLDTILSPTLFITSAMITRGLYVVKHCHTFLAQ